jgi:FAD/FMN-containing dehydrogenase
LELVYGTGDDFRTGSASGPGSLVTLKADKVNPWGPGTVDYFRLVSGAQGTLGLVTWAITKVEVLPSMHELYFIPLDNVETITNIMNQLLRRRIVDECLALNNVNLATILADSTLQDYEHLKQILPKWTLIVGISGYRLRPEERMEIQKKHLLEVCADLGAKAFPHLQGLEGKEKRIADLLADPWKEETYWKMKYGRVCQDIFYLTQLSKVANLHDVMQSVTDKSAYSQDIGGYIQPMVQGRGCHCEYNLFYPKDDTKRSAEVNSFFLEASQTLMNKGGFFSRPYGKWSNMVYSQNAAEVSSLRKLKAIYDPLNILNPGKLCF